MPSDLTDELDLLNIKIDNTINQHISDFNVFNNKILTIETNINNIIDNRK